MIITRHVRKIREDDFVWLGGHWFLADYGEKNHWSRLWGGSQSSEFLALSELWAAYCLCKVWTRGFGRWKEALQSFYIKQTKRYFLNISQPARPLVLAEFKWGPTWAFAFTLNLTWHAPSLHSSLHFAQSHGLLRTPLTLTSIQAGAL